MLLRTPLLKLEALSRLTGNEIYGKAEFLHVGGSVKDRAALGIIQAAERDGRLRPGGTLVEGTAGNTGIGLAVWAAKRGYKAVIVMPDNQAQEKYQTLNALGAELITVPACAFANPGHFYHTAKRVAEERGAFWADQFENPANWRIHEETTGPEILEQAGGRVDAFFCSAGTGGTLAGVSRYLKSKNASTHVCLVDPYGSGLYSHFKTGEIKSTGSSITEGIGIMRLTANFKEAIIDDAVQVGDQDMLEMLYRLAREEGLMVGTSAALNVQAAYGYALANSGKGLRIVTILGDSATRYLSRVFNPDFLSSKGLTPPV